jgi:cell division septal protein FtsQ
MTKPVHIEAENQPQPSDNKVKELQDQLEQWKDAYQKLEYINSLSEEKTFRLELLNSLNTIALYLKNFLDKLEQSQE